jgi:hypothetical protein
MYPDFFGAASSTRADVQVFNAHIAATSVTPYGQMQTWNKPRGVSMVHFFLIGSGGGGGGGMTGLTGTVRGGGGGGSGSAVANVLISALFVPDQLYIQVPFGGAGGAATVGGTSGSPSVVFVDPVGGANWTFLSTGGASGGGTAGSTAGSAGGGSSGITGGERGFKWGVHLSYSGGNGASGGVVGGGAGANLVQSINFPVLGGAGGATTPAANTNFAGGNITALSATYTILGGQAAGENGRSAPMSWGGTTAAGGGGWNLWGGSGGASGGAGTAGNGGNAIGYGCGGGGGGGGITGGRGGDGGPGFVVITAW